MQCIFCRIAAGESPARIFYEDDEVIVFHDIHPRAPIHLLICPKKHYHDFLSAPEKVHERLAATVKIVCDKLGEKGKDFRLVINNGPKSGQIIFHLHYHLFAGR